eukprot:COSAG01_NODE_53278_length_340_cov_1.033195_1_plen_88_part_10
MTCERTAAAPLTSKYLDKPEHTLRAVAIVIVVGTGQYHKMLFNNMGDIPRPPLPVVMMNETCISIQIQRTQLPRHPCRPITFTTALDN